MAKKPKGYYSKGKVKSFNAVDRANAKQSLTTLKGIAGLVGGAVLEGIGGPAGRGAKVAKTAVRLAGRRGTSRDLANLGKSTASRVQKKVTAKEQLKVNARANSSQIKKNKKAIVEKHKARALRTTTGQGRKKVPDSIAKAMAKEAAGPKAKAPFGRAPKVSKPAVGRIMTKSEKDRDAYYKSKQNPVQVTQGKPKPKTIKTQDQKDLERRIEIRKAMRGKPGKRAPQQPAKPLRSIEDVLSPLKGKKVKVDTETKLVNGKIVERPIRMDALDYASTKLAQRAAAKEPKNSVAASTRAQQKARADKAETRKAKEARREEILARVREMRDTSASKANPKRYSSPEQEYGNVRQTEGLIAQGEKRIQEEFRRKAIEREKIANTARAKKQVEATLQRARDREAALRATQRVKDVDAARLRVKPNLKRRGKK